MAGQEFESQNLDPQKQLRQVLGVLKQSWFTIFTFTMLGLLVGIALYNFMPRMYVSEAKVMLRKSWVWENKSNEVRSKEIPGAIRGQLLEDQLTSANWLNKVLDELEWPEWSRVRTDEMERRDYIDKLRARVRVYIRAAELGEILVFIQFQHTDRWMARDFVRGLRDRWLSEVVESFGDSLEREISLKREALRDKEQLLQKYRGDLTNFEDRNSVSVVRVADDFIVRSQQLTFDMDGLVQQIVELEAREDAYLEKLAQTDEEGNLLIPPTITAAKPLSNPEYEARILEIGQLTAELDALRARDYTDKHQAVISKKAQLESAFMALSEAGIPDLEMLVEERRNPDYQVVQDQIDELRIRMRGLKARRETVQRELQEVEEHLATMPYITRQLESMRSAIQAQDWIVTQAKLELEPLLDKQKAMSMPDKHRVFPYTNLEEPVPAKEAVATTGLVALGASVFIGIGIAAVLIFGRELLRNTFRTSEEAQRAMQLPVLGEVAPIQTELEARRARLQRTLQIAASLTLLVGLAATIYLCTAHPELLPVWLVERAAEVRAGMS